MGNFGLWLLNRRKQARLTQGQLAERAGISTSYVSTLERGAAHHLTNAPPQPKLDIVDSLARALGATINEARLEAGYAGYDEAFTIDIGDKAQVKLADRNLSEDDQKEIADELSLAYEVIMARRRARQTQNEQ